MELQYFVYFLIIAFCSVSFAQHPAADYSCPQTCSLPSCRCASVDIPGGIAKEDTPQFISVTFDDAITDAVWTNGIEPFLNEQFARDEFGCTPRGTFFVTHAYSDYALVQHAAYLGHEIGLHTVNHQTGVDTTQTEWHSQLSLNRKYLQGFARIPPQGMTGVRAPYLSYNKNLFAVMKAEDLEYDSSMWEYYGWHRVSQVETGFIWPYTLDYGSPQECDNPGCEQPAAAPGIWEFPLYDLLFPVSGDPTDHNGPTTVVSTMDPALGGPELSQLLRWNFEEHYLKNRAPLGIYLHATWFGQDSTRLPVLLEFLRWASSQPNVVFASNSQMLQWLRAPIPLSEMRGQQQWAQCGSAPAARPPSSCLQEGSAQWCHYPSGSLRACVQECPSALPALNTQGLVCGDGVCYSPVENSQSCPADCGGAGSGSSTSTSPSTGAPPPAKTLAVLPFSCSGGSGTSCSGPLACAYCGGAGAARLLKTQPVQLPDFPRQAAVSWTASTLSSEATTAAPVTTAAATAAAATTNIATTAAATTASATTAAATATLTAAAGSDGASTASATTGGFSTSSTPAGSTTAATTSAPITTDSEGGSAKTNNEAVNGAAQSSGEVVLPPAMLALTAVGGCVGLVGVLVAVRSCVKARRNSRAAGAKNKNVTPSMVEEAGSVQADGFQDGNGAANERSILGLLAGGDDVKVEDVEGSTISAASVPV